MQYMFRRLAGSRIRPGVIKKYTVDGDKRHAYPRWITTDHVLGSEEVKRFDLRLCIAFAR